MSGQSAKALGDLLDWIRGTKRQFNAALSLNVPGDVDHLALVGNGEGWEVCNEDGTYDLWFKGSLVKPDLSLEEAGRFLLDEYEKAKAERVLKRMAPELTGRARKEALAMLRGEIREQGSNADAIAIVRPK